MNAGESKIVGIVDYGMGNLASVAGAVERLGHQPAISSDLGALAEAQRLILPGVGAFADAMQELRSRKLIPVLEELVLGREIPVLGICLGAQLLTKESEEFGLNQGLGWLDARTVRIDPSDAHLRVPHVGWNDLLLVKDSPLTANLAAGSLFYYVHSYCILAQDPGIVVGECDYGTRFAAALQAGHIFATQFHPEKSQKPGLQILRNFIDLA